MIDWPLLQTIFLATSPLLAVGLSLLGVVVFNLLDIRAMRKDFMDMRTEFNARFERIETELKEIRKELSKITERVATLEERDRPRLIRQ